MVIVHWDHLKREEIIRSSPIRFGEGGRARFARLVRNHEVAISGRIICKPRVRRRVRVCVRS